MTQPAKRTDHVDVGVVARSTEANGFKLAVCVGFGRDHRPRVRFFRAAAGRWTRPELVDRAPLGDVEMAGPSRQHTVVTRALEALRAMPGLGFGSTDLAILATDDVTDQAPGPTDGGGLRPWQRTVASHVDLTGETVRRLRATCADGSPLAEDCDAFLDDARGLDEDAAAAADRLVEVLNEGARRTRRRLAQLADDHLLDLQRDPKTPPSLRWEAQVALGQTKTRANKSAARRAGARRACLDYWNARVAEIEGSSEGSSDGSPRREDAAVVRERSRRLVLRDLHDRHVKTVDWHPVYGNAGVLVMKEGDASRFFVCRQIRDGDVTFNEVRALLI